MHNFRRCSAVVAAHHCHVHAWETGEDAPRRLNSLHFGALIEQLEHGSVRKVVNDVETSESRSADFTATSPECPMQEAELGAIADLLGGVQSQADRMAWICEEGVGPRAT